MKHIIKEAYLFLEATTIHGLVYLSRNQARSTRIIWTLIVLTAFAVASYFLSQTVQGFDTKYTSTTIEDRSINDYPFPAVTFDPNVYNSKIYFLRTFLNQFEFTAYKEDSPKKMIFIKQFNWLVPKMQKSIFEGVEKFLQQDI